MISFKHRQTQYTLQPGEAWSSERREEYYRDTSASELWSIVDEVKAGTPWRDVIKAHYAERQDWLYRIVCDPRRENFVRQHPFPADSWVLDVGAGWGQYTLPLARTCNVVAVEPTPERLAFIRAAAMQERVAERCYFVEADMLDLEMPARFDFVCCIGVLEWVPKFRDGDPWTLQRDFLARLRRTLKPGGSLVLGIENRMGLKYLLGTPDDHHGQSLVSVYDADLAAAKFRERTGQVLRSFTYSHHELSDLLGEAGFASLKFWAAYPDYKLPEQILPLDESLEQAQAEAGLLAEEYDGSCGRPLAMGAELRSHYRTLAQMKIARYFAPSFFVSATP